MHILTAVAAASVAAQPAIPTWQLDPAPAVTIGGDRGPGEFQRVTGAFRLSTGHIAVVNGATGEIRIFDRRGGYVRSFGRLGSGPGEFRVPSRVWAASDTLFIYDPALMRVTFVLAGLEPRLIGTTRVTAQRASETSVQGRLADGDWLAVATPSFQWEGPKGVRRLISTVGLLPPDGGGTLRSLAKLPSQTYFVHNPSGDVKQGGVIGLTPFSPFSHATVSGDAIWFGAGDGDSLVVVTGGRRRVVRLPIPTRVPTQEAISALRKKGLENSRTPQARAALEASLSPDNFPKRLPYFEALVPGPDGEVWVREYAPLSMSVARYLVIAHDLRPSAWVTVPSAFRVMDAGRSFVGGVHYDAEGVETVRFYGLKR